MCHALAQCRLSNIHGDVSQNYDISFKKVVPKMGTDSATEMGGQKTPYLQSKTLFAVMQHDIPKKNNNSLRKSIDTVQAMSQAIQEAYAGEASRGRAGPRRGQEMLRMARRGIGEA